VNYWLHAEHLIVDGEKMSKSKGNFYLLRDVLDRRDDPAAVRYLFLSVPYRTKLNFSFDALAGAAAAVERLRSLDRRLRQLEEAPSRISPSAYPESDRIVRFDAEFEAAFADDLNTAQALGALFDFVRDVNLAADGNSLSANGAAACRGALRRADAILGVLPKDEEILPADIERLIAERLEARRRRDFARSDAIRDELVGKGVLLEDTPQGTRWKKA
jgi:cysteinyl-tRNA synthetase